MSQHGPSSSLAPLTALSSHIASSGNNLALLVKEYSHFNQNYLDVSLRPPEKAIGPLSLWLILMLLGLSLLPLEFLLFQMVDIEVALIGLSLFATSVVGSSSHVSAYYNDPRYNLWKSLKIFMANHKFLTLCAGAGTLMFNPVAAIIGFSIGIVVDIALYGLLNEIEVQSRRFFDWILNTLTLENAENFLRYCWRHPLNLLSMVMGAGSALKAFTHFFPQIFPMLFNFTLDCFSAVQNLSSQLTSTLSRGFVPHYIITSLAAVVCLVALPATLFALPAIGVIGGGFLGLKIWDTTYNVLAALCKKIYQKIKPPRVERIAEPHAVTPPAPILNALPPAESINAARNARSPVRRTRNASKETTPPVRHSPRLSAHPHLEPSPPAGRTRSKRR